MRAGTLRHVLTKRTPVTTKNARGVETISSYTTTTMRGNVTSMTGRELVANDQVTAMATHQIETRFREDITTKDTMIWDGRYFGITSIVEPDNRRRRLLLMCTEIVGTDRVL